jgi:hypothetical protein
MQGYRQAPGSAIWLPVAHVKVFLIAGCFGLAAYAVIHGLIFVTRQFGYP